MMTTKMTQNPTRRFTAFYAVCLLCCLMMLVPVMAQADGWLSDDAQPVSSEQAAAYLAERAQRMAEREALSTDEMISLDQDGVLSVVIVVPRIMLSVRSVHDCRNKGAAALFDFSVSFFLWG